MIKVLIVEDHQSVIDGITRTFTETGRYKIIGNIPNAEYAEVCCKKLSPDLVFMDVCTEGDASGLKGTEEIKKLFPKIKIIVMTAFDEITYMPRAKEAGADGFLYKSRSLSDFIKTADNVMEGIICFPEPKTLEMPKGEAPLTPREMDVLRLICKHMTNKEIGEELFISENTVKYHKSNMLAKTGFDNSVDLAFYMISKGYINPLF